MTEVHLHWTEELVSCSRKHLLYFKY